MPSRLEQLTFIRAGAVMVASSRRDNSTIATRRLEATTTDKGKRTGQVTGLAQSSKISRIST